MITLHKYILKPINNIAKIYISSNKQHNITKNRIQKSKRYSKTEYQFIFNTQNKNNMKYTYINRREIVRIQGEIIKNKQKIRQTQNKQNDQQTRKYIKESSNQNLTK